MRNIKPHISYWKHGYPCFRVTMDDECQSPAWAIVHTWLDALKTGCVLANCVERQRNQAPIRNLFVLDVDTMDTGLDAQDHKRRHIAQMHPTLSAGARQRMVKHYYDE